MKCANCDAEIKDGSIYCPVCGKEAQMVNGYVSLEDDFLHSLLREGINKRILSPEEQARLRKRKQAMPIIVTGLILAILIAVGVVVKLFIDYKNDNSYEYYICNCIVCYCNYAFNPVNFIFYITYAKKTEKSPSFYLKKFLII